MNGGCWVMKPHGKFFATLALMAVFADAAAASDVLAQKYFVTVSAQLDPRAQAALARMDGLGRQLLAARSYLRAGSTLDKRWSWTQQQIDAFAGSAAQMALDAEIARVRAAFERDNPGYSLFVNPQVRSLELQLQRWNKSASVAQAGDRIMAQVTAAIREPGFPPPGTAAGAARFRELLTRHTSQSIATIAAPGLSAHGRMSAVDFQVQHGNTIVAAADSTKVESVWIAQDWRDRLHSAVVSAGNRFTGPQAGPFEPWHYDYLPRTGLP
jgi:hypothetical protein